VLDILPCHDLMRVNTYRSLVEVDILLHSVLVVDNCDIPLVLYPFQSLLFLFLHLCSQFDPLVARYIEVPSYTAWCYSVAVRYCTVAAQCYMVVVQYYTAAAQCCMGMLLV
jgi:hypothetical protein